MWNFIVLVALVATAHGEDYTERLARTMNEAINSRCGFESTEGFTGICTELESGYDYDTLKKQFDEASTTIAGFCIYNQDRTHSGETRLTSIAPLMLILSLLSNNANNGQLKTELYNLINLNDNNEMRYLIPKIAAEISNEESTGFLSTISITAYTSTENKFSESFENCIKLINGATKVLDYSDTEQVAEEINQGHVAPVVKPEDIYPDTGLIFSSKHHVEISFTDFVLSISEVSEDETVRPSVWVGEGLAKVYYQEEFKAQVIQLALYGGLTLTVVQPQAGRHTEFLFNTRDYKSFASLMDSSAEFEYTKLTIPMYAAMCGSEDYVDNLKLVNQMSQIYSPGYDGFLGILENGSGHLSHMYHQMCVEVVEVDGAGTTSYSDSPRDVLVNSTYIVYIRNPDGTPLITALIPL